MKDAPTIIRYTTDFFYIKMVRSFNLILCLSYQSTVMVMSGHNIQLVDRFYPDWLVDMRNMLKIITTSSKQELLVHVCICINGLAYTHFVGKLVQIFEAVNQ